MLQRTAQQQQQWRRHQQQQQRWQGWGLKLRRVLLASSRRRRLLWVRLRQLLMRLLSSRRLNQSSMMRRQHHLLLLGRTPAEFLVRCLHQQSSLQSLRQLMLPLRLWVGSSRTWQLIRLLWHVIQRLLLPVPLQQSSSLPLVWKLK